MRARVHVLPDLRAPRRSPSALASSCLPLQCCLYDWLQVPRALAATGARTQACAPSTRGPTPPPLWGETPDNKEK